MIGPKSTSPMPGPLQVDILRVEVAGLASISPDQIGHRGPGLAALGFHVHVQLEVRMVDLLDHRHGLGAGVQEVGLAGGQRLEAEIDAHFADGRA